MPRVQSLNSAFNDHPFTGSGASLYATIGTTVLYRALRVLPNARKRRNRCAWIKGQGGRHNIAAASVLKTTRVASAASPATSIPYPLPSELANQTVTFDVRQYADDVENTTDNFRTVTKEIDGDLEDGTGILGTAVLLSVEPRAGGICRIRFNYFDNPEGVQPTVFRASRTAGPSSPAATTASYSTGQRLVEIDTAVLLDSSPYTFKVTAENSGATVTEDLIVGITVQADATGPAAPISGEADAR